MKRFKNIVVSSDGSCYFCDVGENLLTNQMIVFRKQDDKSFSFNQKKGQVVIDSKHSFYYKKKYLK